MLSASRNRGVAWSKRARVAWTRFFRHPQWNIGILHRTPAELIETGCYSDERVDWLPLRGRTRFFADPFGLVVDGTLYILCEEFDYRNARGRIVAFAYGDGKFERLADPAFDLPMHVSYPFVLEDGGQIYCIPEMSAANELALFRATQFPSSWTKDSVLLPGFAAIDPTMFRHDGKWWLACTERGSREDVDLLLWHAPALHGPWTPHAANPVKSDVTAARPAGRPFVVDGMLYRPAQDCSKRYGWRVTVQRVNRLTATEFVEEPAAVVEAPPHGRFSVACHTLTPVGDYVLIDGCRDRFVPLAFRAFLRIWLRSCRWSRS